MQVARTARVDVELGVGNLQETVTVSGVSPVVDVSSTVTQTNIDKNLYEAIPTGRNPWTMAGLVPGVVTGRLDVGGTEGAQQYNIEAFGSANSQKSFSIDGLKVNWAGGDGGATMMYYGFEMYDEYNMQTASGTAESDVSGVFMNMVTKSGGNRFTSDHNFYFMNDALQGSNIDDDLRRGSACSRDRRPARPATRSTSATTGARRSAARSRATRRGSSAPSAGGAGSVPDRREQPGRFPGHRRQPHPQLHGHLADHTHHPHVVPLQQEHQRSLPPPRPALPDRRGQGDRAAEPAGAELRRAVQPRARPAHGAGRAVRPHVGRLPGPLPGGGAADRHRHPRRRRNTRINAAETQSLNPNGRYQGNFTGSYFLDSARAGTHDLKAGLQLSWERVEHERIRNGDILLELQDGRPFQAQLSNTPINSDHRLNTWGVFLQDRWLLGRATVTAGLRIDGVSAHLPAQTSPAGTYVEARSFPEADVFDFGPNVAPRLGVSHDLFGNGRTALKAYYGRFYNQFGSQISEAANPNAIVNQAVSWTDTTATRRSIPGSSAPLPVSRAGCSRLSTPAPRVPTARSTTSASSNKLAGNMAIGVSYHRREHRNGLGILDRARGFDAYAPIDRSYVDPITGQTQSITIYNLRPEYINARDRYISNVEALKSNYDGVQFDFQKRMSNRWQMLAGLSLQQHRGFDHSGTYTGTDFSNPNSWINRDDSSVFIDLPWVLTLSGTYQLPWDIMFSGKLHVARRRPAQPDGDVHRPDDVAGQRDGATGAARHGSDRGGDAVHRPAVCQALPHGQCVDRAEHRPVQPPQRQPRPAAERADRLHVGAPDTHPDAADHPFGVTARF